ncbi:unnamed protein product [Auanema sp. JU1783]|nr:unnamed protein product [Auanema sp. JU1783]
MKRGSERDENETLGINGIEKRSPSPKRRTAVEDIGVTRVEKMIAVDPPKLKNTQKIAILDFGAQYGKVIDRRVREAKVCSEMFPLHKKAKDLVEEKFAGIIISGGPNSVYDPHAPQVDPEIFTCGLPVLGICYGFQLLNKNHQGSVVAEKIREDGQCTIDLDTSCPLFVGMNAKEEVLLTHGDSVSESSVAPGFKVVGRSGSHVAAIANDEKKLYGVQFHPEVDLTTNGKMIFENFLYRIANCRGDFTMENREDVCIAEIRKVVGDKKVLVMVSGGVDSTVCAALLHKALGNERVTAIHIDNGFMRENESEAVIASLNALKLSVHGFNCEIEFMQGTINGTKEEVKLESTLEPEEKRQIIGNTFIRVKDRIMDELQLDQDEYFLAQGTLRPDLIESASSLASGHADTIKTHHNDTELVRKLRDMGRVIEPLKDFHKDEVRELGASLGLPEEIVQRQPFPGPGLCIRILCGVKPYKCSDFEITHSRLNIISNLHKVPDLLEDQHYRASVIESMDGWNLENLLNKNFDINSTLLPIKSVGVQGDSRSYSYVVALSTDQRPIPWDHMATLAQVIPKIVHNINRVVYAFGAAVKHPIYSITPTYLSSFTVRKLQKADKIATDILFGHAVIDGKQVKLEDCSKKIQQMPVVMVPIHFDRDPAVEPNSYQHSFVVRPFITSDFMTGIAAIPGKQLSQKSVLMMAEEISARVMGTSRIMIDLTSKPPGTTEWE